MKTTLRHFTVAEICEGFSYLPETSEATRGLAGRLTIQPAYQRNYIYGINNTKDIDVIRSMRKGYPLGLFYFVKTQEGQFEVLDGQQRITSIGRYLTNEMAVDEFFYQSLTKEEQEQIDKYELLAYVCEGTSREILDWFQTINIAGFQLEPQEINNAVFTGPFVSAAKREFSDHLSPQAAVRKILIEGKIERQAHLAEVLKWISNGSARHYLGKHQYDPDANALVNYYNIVQDWVFTHFEKCSSMKGLNWGRLYNEYGSQHYDSSKLRAQVNALMADEAVTAKAGIYEFVLGGCKDHKLLNIRAFPESIKTSKYAAQTNEYDSDPDRFISNCPECRERGTHKRYNIKEMEGNHIIQWILGGATDPANCNMLCKNCNARLGAENKWKLNAKLQ